jgi:hypothetical protein
MPSIYTKKLALPLRRFSFRPGQSLSMPDPATVVTHQLEDTKDE